MDLATSNLSTPLAFAARNLDGGGDCYDVEHGEWSHPNFEDAYLSEQVPAKDGNVELY
jgi:hypothetical protein